MVQLNKQQFILTNGKMFNPGIHFGYMDILPNQLIPKPWKI